MAWKWRDIPGLLASPNRGKALSRAWHAWSWLPIYPLAWLYRRTVVRSVKVVVVVGSTGKTTTTGALEQVLGLAHPSQLNANFGFFLVRKLAGLRPGQKVAVMEVGISRPGQMARYGSMLRPDLVVVTTVGTDHHVSLGGMSGVSKEKAAMVKALLPGGLAVLNGDDARVRSMAEMTRADVVFYGLGKDNQVRADNIKLDWPRGSSFTLVAPGVRERMSLPLWGEHFILSALAACAVGLHLGRGLDEIKAGLSRLTPVRGRMHPVSLGDDIWLVEDYYKNTQETIEVALDFMARAPAKRKIVVMGALETPMGSSNTLSRELGRNAGRVADRLLFLGDKFQRVSVGAKNSGLARESIINCHGSIHTAAQELKDRLEPGDLVLIKGRGDQQLRRITLLLQGREVSCATGHCTWTQVTCDECPLLNPAQGPGNAKAGG